VTGCCDHGNEPLGFIEYGEFLDYLRSYWLLKKESDVRSYPHNFTPGTRFANELCSKGL
jgi:hypothetical protein